MLQGAIQRWKLGEIYRDIDSTVYYKMSRCKSKIILVKLIKLASSSSKPILNNNSDQISE